jgi:tetratricopeptide (TPR) repeat protein
VNDINASSLDERGKKEYAKGAYLAAAKFFAQAGQAYENANDPLNAAEMKNNQSVALLQGGKADDALKATEGTEEIFAGAGDLKRQGIAIANRAAALEGLKKWQEALAEYDRAASAVRTSRRRRYALDQCEKHPRTYPLEIWACEQHANGCLRLTAAG